MSYSYSLDEETYHGTFDTRDEAIEEAPKSRSFWVGLNVPPTSPENYWYADVWLETVSCQDDYSLDCSEGWDRSTREQREELEQEVRAVLAAWLDRHGLRPQFWLVTDVVKCTPDGMPVEEGKA